MAIVLPDAPLVWWQHQGQADIATISDGNSGLMNVEKDVPETNFYNENEMERHHSSAY